MAEARRSAVMGACALVSLAFLALCAIWLAKPVREDPDKLMLGDRDASLEGHPWHRNSRRVVKYDWTFTINRQLDPDCYGGTDRHGNKRQHITCNGQFPGPEVRVEQGDIVEVHVTNLMVRKDQGHNIRQGMTVHWHGLQMRGKQWYDGVGYVTQCPIGFNQRCAALRARGLGPRMPRDAGGSRKARDRVPPRVPQLYVRDRHGGRGAGHPLVARAHGPGQCARAARRRAAVRSARRRRGRAARIGISPSHARAWRATLPSRAPPPPPPPPRPARPSPRPPPPRCAVQDGMFGAFVILPRRGTERPKGIPPYDEELPVMLIHGWWNHSGDSMEWGLSRQYPYARAPRARVPAPAARAPRRVRA